VKFNISEMLCMTSNGEIRPRYRVYDTRTMFCLGGRVHRPLDKTSSSYRIPECEMNGSDNDSDANTLRVG